MSGVSDTSKNLGSRIGRAIRDNRVYRSIVRHGALDSNRNRSLVVFTNFFLHIHPVKVRRRAIEFKRTFYLGGLSAACFFIPGWKYHRQRRRG